MTHISTAPQVYEVRHYESSPQMPKPQLKTKNLAGAVILILLSIPHTLLTIVLKHFVVSYNDYYRLLYKELWLVNYWILISRIFLVGMAIYFIENDNEKY